MSATQVSIGQLLDLPLKHIRIGWDESLATVTLTSYVVPIQCFSLGVLAELKQVTDLISELTRGTVRQLVFASDVAGVYNFGGDLSLFVLLVRAKSLHGLKLYGRQCVDLVHWLECAADRGIYTLALVRGDALGGGLESVLPVHCVIIERGTQAGFPEVLFNLYPGMGAWHFVARRSGFGVATRMITSGAIYGADELHRLCVVDVVAGAGDGERVLHQEIRKSQPKLRGLLSALRMRSRISPVTLQQLQNTVDDWAQAALGLTDRDLRLMERLARAQLQKVGGSEYGVIEAIKRLEIEAALAAQPSANEEMIGVNDAPVAA